MQKNICHSIYTRTIVNKFPAPVVCFSELFNLVHGQFRQSNMHLDLIYVQTNQERIKCTKVKGQRLTVLIYICTMRDTLGAWAWDGKCQHNVGKFPICAGTKTFSNATTQCVKINSEEVFFKCLHESWF